MIWRRVIVSLRVMCFLGDGGCRMRIGLLGELTILWHSRCEVGLGVGRTEGLAMEG